MHTWCIEEKCSCGGYHQVRMGGEKLGGLMFSSKGTEAKLRKTKMLSLLWDLMTSTKLVDIVWDEIISMEILHTCMVPICLTIMQVLFAEMLPIFVRM